LKSKDVIKKINNNIEFNLMQKHHKKAKNKFAHTTNNSRQNSGEKYYELSKPKLLALKHNKLILNNIRELNSNNNIKNKQASTQTTIDNKVNKNINKKNNNNQNNTNCKNETKGIIIKTNNNCQTKNHILRKNNQETMKLSHTNAKGKIKVMNVKLNNDKININLNINNNYLKTSIFQFKYKIKFSIFYKTKFKS